MPGPRPPEIVLSEDERAALERVARAHTTGQQLAVRARVVLLAADGLTTSAVARALGLHVDTARQWRARWRRFRDVPLDEVGVAARLADAPKPGAPGAAARAIEAIVRLRDAVGAPGRLRELGVPREALPRVAAEALRTEQAQNPRPATEADLLAICQRAW